MKLIIDIPEEDYICLRDEGMFGNVTTFKRAVREGIPLEQEPCEDVISRKDTLKLIYDFKEKHTEDRKKHPINYGTLLDLIRLIRELPPVNPAEKVGQWVKDDNDYEYFWRCSKCNKRSDVGWEYCPNCGAKMEGEQNKWMAADVLNHWIGAEALDKIRDEIIDINVVRDEYSQRQNDYCDGVEFAKRYVLQIIDKYKAES